MNDKNYNTRKQYLKKRGDSNSEVTLIQNEVGEFIVQKVIYGIDSTLYRTIYSREINALMKLNNCDNIVKILSYSDSKKSKNTNECVGIINMEYIQGSKLSNYNFLRLNLKNKYRVIYEIINALENAHLNGIIHRDLNPNNILLDSNNNDKIKIIDFGFCKIKDMSNGETTYQFITGNYSAPEIQSNVSNANEQSDIYSLGAIVYFIFTGENPPIFSQFSKEILESKEIEQNIKALILKCIDLDTSQRYEDIYQVREDFEIITKKYLKSSQTLTLVCSSIFIQMLQNYRFVPKLSKFDIDIKRFLESDFEVTFAQYNKDGDKFYFFGKRLKITCKFAYDDDSFLITDVIKMNPNERQKITKDALQIDACVKFCEIKDMGLIYYGNNLEIKNDLIDFEEESRSLQNINKKFIEKYGVWKDLLDFLMKAKQDANPRYSYVDYKYNDDLLILTMNDDTYFEGIELNASIAFMIYRSSKRKDKKLGIRLGTYHNLVVNADKVQLHLKFSKRISFDKNGDLYLDNSQDISNIHRQIVAYDIFENYDYKNKHNLKKILLGMDKPTVLKRDLNKAIVAELDNSQEAALKIALSSNPISIIQGPPGTGKTKVIISIIEQIIDFNKKNETNQLLKVLIVSQTHLAVDKVVLDLYDKNLNNLNLIRIGNDSKINEKIKDRYSLEISKMKWIENIKNKCQSDIDYKCKVYKIDATQLKEYYNYRNKIDYQLIPEETICENQEFENDIHSRNLTRELEVILIQMSWLEEIIRSTEAEYYQIKTSEIIAGTCVGFLANPFIRDIAFDYVIIDEAAKATFTELLISMNLATNIILVGDHLQLPPVLDEDIITKNKENFDYEKLRRSVFEDIFEILPDESKMMLSIQYRMHPIIGSLISDVFYDGNLQNGAIEEDRLHGLKGYENIVIEWINTGNIKGNIINETRKLGSENETYINQFEAKIIKNKLEELDSLCDRRLEIAVIAAYSGQKVLLKEKLSKFSFKNLDIEIDTVDAFQGNQKEIVIYSTVRSNNNPYNIGFLKTKARVNVAFSRAMSLLIIVGNLNFLNHSEVKGNAFPKVIDYIKANNKCRIVDVDRKDIV